MEGRGEVWERADIVVPESDADVILKYPTLFGDVNDKRVTFCVDTSGSMYKCLDAIKEDLKKTLLKLSLEPDTHFNVIEFSTKVSQWSDGLVRCTPEAVMLAHEWIDKLEAKTGTNALDALLAALKDNSCEAVYFVTDGLPDQNPSEVLDFVMEAVGNRPIHCYYIESGTTDPEAIDFLQDLAIETFGSFHIVCITQHGAIESVTPVYRADASQERIIRTSSGNVYPASLKECTVSTALDSSSRFLMPPTSSLYFTGSRHWPDYTTGYYAYPYLRHHYFCYPDTGWSRYRPAKSWMRTAEKFIDVATAKHHFVPGAGALLIDKKVLARRNEDGFYYLGKVRSQIYEDQFLVEFLPCKHGEFRKASYQETFVYDIISLDDAHRHSILPGDKVLAPWEPESSRYGPGVVVEGQEKRLAEVGIPHKDVTIGFFNGLTLKTPNNTAVWIPPDLHDRITFELKLPARVRMELVEGVRRYPYDGVPGFPSTGSTKSSLELDTFEPLLIESRPGYYERGLYRKPYFVPLYKQLGSNFSPPPGYVETESDRLIPGTELTESQLNEKVMNQLLLHKMVSENDYSSRLLSRRSQQEENNRLRKSVTFAEEGVDGDVGDSGRGSDTDAAGLTDADLEELLGESADTNNNAASKIDPRLLYRRRRRRKELGARPPWRYSKKDQIPELLESNHYGPYRLGAFRETAVAKPMKSEEKFGSWSTSQSEFFKRYENETMRSASVRDSMGYSQRPFEVARVAPPREPRIFCPRPPDDKAKGPRLDIEICFSKGRTDDEAQMRARNDFRRRQIMERHERMNNRQEEELRRSEAMRDKHRQQTMNRIEYERARENKQVQMEQQQRETKTIVRHEIRTRLEDQQRHEVERDEQRLSRMRSAKLQRAETHNLRAQEQTERDALREQGRREKTHRQIVSQMERAEEADQQRLVRDIAKHNAQVNRIEHFHALEERAQAHKQLAHQVAEQNNHILRAQALP